MKSFREASIRSAHMTASPPISQLFPGSESAAFHLPRALSGHKMFLVFPLEKWTCSSACFLICPSDIQEWKCQGRSSPGAWHRNSPPPRAEWEGPHLWPYLLKSPSRIKEQPWIDGMVCPVVSFFWLGKLSERLGPLNQSKNVEKIICEKMKKLQLLKIRSWKNSFSLPIKEVWRVGFCFYSACSAPPAPLCVVGAQAWCRRQIQIVPSVAQVGACERAIGLGLCVQEPSCHHPFLVCFLFVALSKLIKTSINS